MKVEDHKIAALFPLIAPVELESLAADIKANGLQERITLHEGKILDGRNRYRACELAGVEPSFCDYQGASPVAFVVSKNLKRRHLNSTQLACASVECLPWLEKEAKERQGRRNDLKRPNITQQIERPSRNETTATAQAAQLFKTNRQYVADAKKIKETEPALFEELKSGKRDMAEAKREIRRKAHVKRLMEAAQSPRPRLVTGPYDIIVADPPWEYEDCKTENREITNHYSTATLVEIASHFQQANPEPRGDCILFLWATAPKLAEALWIMDQWGFRYRSCAVWDKEVIGMGYWWRIQHEHLLVGVRGQPGATPEFSRVSSIFRERRGKHSAKPECIYRWIEEAFPGSTKLEMYCRHPRPGWGFWGNEL